LSTPTPEAEMLVDAVVRTDDVLKVAESPIGLADAVVGASRDYGLV
jgi:hypothetical protein